MQVATLCFAHCSPVRLHWMLALMRPNLFRANPAPFPAFSELLRLASGQAAAGSRPSRRSSHERWVFRRRYVISPVSATNHPTVGTGVPQLNCERRLKPMPWSGPPCARVAVFSSPSSLDSAFKDTHGARPPLCAILRAVSTDREQRAKIPKCWE